MGLNSLWIRNRILYLDYYFDWLNVAFCQKINMAHKNLPNHDSEQTVLNLVNIKHKKNSKFLLRIVISRIYLCCIEVSDKKLPLKPVMMENIS
jgi:hypothetical protein